MKKILLISLILALAITILQSSLRVKTLLEWKVPYRLWLSGSIPIGGRTEGGGYWDGSIQSLSLSRFTAVASPSPMAVPSSIIPNEISLYRFISMA